MVKTASQQNQINSQNIQTPDLIDHNLSLTPEERLLQHQKALDTLNELKKAGKELYGEFESSSQTSPRK